MDDYLQQRSDDITYYSFSDSVIHFYLKWSIIHQNNYFFIYANLEWECCGDCSIELKIRQQIRLYSLNHQNYFCLSCSDICFHEICFWCGSIHSWTYWENAWKSQKNLKEPTWSSSNGRARGIHDWITSRRRQWRGVKEDKKHFTIWNCYLRKAHHQSWCSTSSRFWRSWLRNHCTKYEGQYQIIKH